MPATSSALPPRRSSRRRLRSSHGFAATLFALLLAAPDPALAVGPVTGLAASRSGDDLVLSWDPASPAVDGYRVYHSADVSCTSLTLLYQGSARQFTISGAFQDFATALYGVAAYAGGDEGPRAGPVYKYTIDLPVPAPGSIGGRIASLPYHSAIANAWLLCADLNNSLPPVPPTRVLGVVRSVAEMGTVMAQACTTPVQLTRFQVLPGEAYHLRGLAEAASRAVLWGVGDTPGTVQLGFPYVDEVDCDRGNHWVSLPLDHAYPDLASIAAEVPGVVGVQILDADATAGCGYMGLTRPTTADPWSGNNFDLTGRPGEGVVIAVETAPVAWTPRRQCAAFGGGGGPSNLPPVADAGGPYDSTLCHGGVIGIWLDGSASLDPDGNVPLTYEWTSTCAGTVSDPAAPITSALFECNPCFSLNCSVTLTVTDARGGVDVDVEPVFSRRVNACRQAGNVLKITRAGGQLALDWSQAPAADNYVLLGDDQRALGSPARVSCGVDRGITVDSGAAALELFSVDGLDEPCAR